VYQAPNTARVEASHRMYVQANPTSFGATPSDDFMENAHGVAAATRNRPRDATAYSTEPTQRHWNDRVNFAQETGSVFP